MHESVIEMLSYYRRKANSCYGYDAYKTIDEIISVLSEEVPLVKSKKFIIEKPYNRTYDGDYNKQLTYLGKMIDMKIAELDGAEKKKSQRIEELQKRVAVITEEKNTLEEKYKSLCLEHSELEEKYSKAIKELMQ